MAPLSARSQALLQGVHPRLVQLVTEVTEFLDLAVIQGLRADAEQAVNVAEGRSQTMNSKHLVQPDGFAHAVDLASTPQLWEAEQETRLSRYDVQQIFTLGYLKGYAKAQGLDIRIGIDWDNDNHWDGLQKDKPFLDTDHIELL